MWYLWQLWIHDTKTLVAGTHSWHIRIEFLERAYYFRFSAQSQRQGHLYGVRTVHIWFITKWCRIVFVLRPSGCFKWILVVREVLHMIYTLVLPYQFLIMWVLFKIICQCVLLHNLLLLQFLYMLTLNISFSCWLIRWLFVGSVSMPECVSFLF